MYNRIVTICILLCFCFALSAQWRGVRVTTLSDDKGLNTIIHNVTEDALGYIYLGGSQGLIRYDGNSFTSFSHNPGDSTTIGPGEVYNILSGSDSLLWIGLRFGGLNSFNPKTQRFQRYPMPELPYRRIPSVNGLLEDSEGKLWAGTHHFQLLMLDRKSGNFTAFQPDWLDIEAHTGRLAILKIVEDRIDHNVLWLSVLDFNSIDHSIHGGLSICQFNKKTNTFTPMPISGSLCHQDQEGNIYVAERNKQILKYNPLTKQERIFSIPIDDFGSYTRDVLIDDSGMLTTTGYGLWSSNGNDNFKSVFTIDAQPGRILGKLYKDSSGNTWVSTSEGAIVIDPREQHIRFFSLTALGDPYRIFPGRLAYNKSNDVIYLSHESLISARRLYRIPLAENQLNEAGFLEVTSSVKGLAFDHNGTGWCATEDGMYNITNDGTLVPYTDLGFADFKMPGLWNMRVSEEGWIAGTSGEIFFWFMPDGTSVRHVENKDLQNIRGINHKSYFSGFKFSKNKPEAFLVSNNIVRLNLESGEYSALHYPKEFNPYSIDIFDVEPDYEGNLWATGTNFLARFTVEKDSLVIRDSYSVVNGLASVNVQELFIDRSKRLWLFSDSGINALDPETKEVRYFGVNEGLPSNFCDPRKVLQADDGRIMTVNSNGVIIFHPDSLWNSLSPASVPVVINAIRVNGAPLETNINVNYLNEITIPNGNHVIDIAFQGLSFPADTRLQYSYRLQAEDPWIDIGKNKFITLPSMPPGTYNLQVKAGSPITNAPIRSLQILIPTPYYLKFWFTLLISTLIIGLFYLLYRLRIHAIRKEEERKTEVNKQMAEIELKALRSQMNPHFMFNSLNSIKDYILHSEPKKAAEYLSDFAHLIRMILQNSREKYITLQEELETLRLYIELEQLRFDNSFSFNCIIDEGLSIEQVLIPPMLLQPYIENAIWHGLMHRKEGGHLTLEFSHANGSIHCIIDDDGIGREKAAELRSMSARKYKSMGMGITKDRVGILNSLDSLGIEISIVDKRDDSGRPTGTRVVLSIPKKPQE